jgi:predicted dehydrogenase
MRVGLIGCGVMGRRRVAALALEDQLVAAYDPNPPSVINLPLPLGSREKIFDDPTIEAVIVATPHHELFTNASEALARGKHVLVEKPGALSANELDLLILAAAEAKRALHVGYSLEYHPAALKIYELLSQETAQGVFQLTARYGHGGRVGYDEEWRGKYECGGGALMDLGSHLIHFAIRLFDRSLPWHFAQADKKFWLKGDVDDNVELISDDVSLRASTTEWKNEFKIEIYTPRIKLCWTGLGGSYGVERLTLYEMSPEMGPPSATVFPFDGDVGLQSLRAEWLAFKAGASNPSVRSALETLDTSTTAWNTLNVIDKIRHRFPNRKHFACSLCGWAHRVPHPNTVNGPTLKSDCGQCCFCGDDGGIPIPARSCAAVHAGQAAPGQPGIVASSPKRCETGQTG